MKRIAAAYPHARTIHLIVDNLSTHSQKSLTDALGLDEGQALWSRFTLHFTPKHASWLNPAEIEISLWSRECQGKSRISSLSELKRRTTRWNRRANQECRRIKWRFRSSDGRRVFAYSR